MQEILDKLRELAASLPEEIKMNWFLYNNADSTLSCACGIKPTEFTDVLLHVMTKSPAMRDAVLTAAEVFSKQAGYMSSISSQQDLMPLIKINPKVKS